MRVSIIGTPGSGRTVLMALLYETLVRSATAQGAEGHEQVRFITEPQVTKGLGDIRLDLLSGGWPSKEVRERTASFSIEIGFPRRRWFGFLPSKGFSMVTVENAGIGKRDIDVIEGAAHSSGETTNTTGGKIDPDMLGQSLSKALDSSVIVLLLDASKALTLEGEAPTINKADAFYATLLWAVIGHKPGPYYGKLEERSLPVLFITKCDVLSALSGDGAPRSSGMEMLKKHFPLTAKVLEEDGADRKKVRNVRVFLSGLRTEKDEGGRAVPSPVTEGGQVRLEYQHDQYASFIQFLGTMVRRHPPVGKGKRVRP